MPWGYLSTGWLWNTDTTIYFRCRQTKIHSMSYAKIWIHAAWATKARYPYLSPEVKEKLLKFITGNAREKGVHIDTINTYPDYVQCLFSIEPHLSITQAMQVLMADTATWANRERVTKI